MTKQKITIHRALAELKIIDDRIKRQLNEFIPVGIRQKGKLVNNYYEEDIFKEDAKSTYQSIKDLLERKNKLKNAIVKANAETKVEVAGKTMVIADAINYKTLVDYRKQLAGRFDQVLRSTKSELENKNSMMDENCQRILEAALGKDHGKWDKTSVDAIQAPYLESNQFELVDPLDAEKTKKELLDELDKFSAEVDSCLSEINAITFIEIEQ